MVSFSLAQMNSFSNLHCTDTHIFFALIQSCALNGSAVLRGLSFSRHRDNDET